MGTVKNFYAVFSDNILSIQARWASATNVLHGLIHELRVNGEVVDSHSSDAISKAGTMFAVLVVGGKQTSVRVDVLSRIIGFKYKLTIDGVETPLTKSSEAEIKALWHEKQLREPSRNPEGT